MALITPQQVIDYTEFNAVKNRAPNKLVNDITQAEMELFDRCGHNFTDPEFIPLPQEVTLALIKLAEYHALVNSDESIAKGYTSERLEDYSYTLASGAAVNRPSIELLIAKYIRKPAPKRPISFRIRAI